MVKDLTIGKPAKVLFSFSLPVIAGNLFQLFYTLADTVIVGQTIGADALAAVGATNTIIYLILCFIQGITNGFSIITAQFFGAQDEENVKKSTAAALLLSLLFTVAITILICIFAKPILKFMHTPDEIFSLSYDYMIVIFIGTGATFFYNILSNLLRSFGDSKTPLYFLVLSSILNIGLDFLLILPFQMGVAGAAWATVLSQLLSAVCCFIYAVRAFPQMRLSKKYWKLEKNMAVRLLKTGFPMGFQMSVMCIGQLAMQSAVNKLGTNAIAGYTAATKIDQFSVLINNAFGITISNFAAQNFGAQNYDRIKKGVTSAFFMTEAANLMMCFIVLLGQSFIVPVFVNTPNEEIFSYARDYLWTVAPFYLFLGTLMIYRTAIQSMGNTLVPFLACIIELFMRVGCSVFGSALWGYKGICFSSPLAWFGTLPLLLPVYFIMIKTCSQKNMPFTKVKTI